LSEFVKPNAFVEYRFYFRGSREKAVKDEYNALLNTRNISSWEKEIPLVRIALRL